MCGCKTPNLLMANRACEGDCYPKMLNSKIWKRFKKGNLGIEWKTESGEYITILKYGDKPRRSTREYQS